ncbi:ATP-binding cassette domain-containing protein [Fructilactobacillus hinvesii]|uniref:ATP-binding cassette domain-containing protein n=1 Tax=Fructilactobacillus hinvesii TaxID=2940300 RepID=A0ABY5BXT6_9LACO|nr:ATP-binding cassette domain-containing protein [Fructilactobacillus hinvesii]USS88549.1 ATP-binding cassette domain-containing protein [Fructilactobacillus hinvesii]
MPKIELHAPQLGYRDEHKVVLRDADLTLTGGNVYALVGSNGAGKSTLLKTLIGVLQPLTGTVCVTVPDSQRPAFGQIGFCPQFPLVDWYTRVYDNVRLGPLLAGQSWKTSRQNVARSLRLLGIEKLQKAAMDHISGGQQQRVQLARELAKRPEIYLLDEPTTGLDVETIERLFTYLQQQAQAGALVLIASHDLTSVEAYANQLIFLDQGVVQYQGSVAGFVQNDLIEPSVHVTICGNSQQLADLNKFLSRTVTADGSFRIPQRQLEQVLSFLTKHQLRIVKLEAIHPSLRTRYLQLKRGEATHES